MNLDLQTFFQKFYNQRIIPDPDERGSSSPRGTEYLRSQLPDLFSRHKIYSMFDAGCSDCSWAHMIDVSYRGGDISQSLIESVHLKYPNLDVMVFDVTTDPLPKVDLLFCRDVAIHLSGQDKLRMIDNWNRSEIPWIMMTHIPEAKINIDIEYQESKFPWAEVNWCLAPWNWPAPTDQAWEMKPGGRCMALWHRAQIWQ